MRRPHLLILLSGFVSLASVTGAKAQVTSSDVLFARLSSSTARMAYEQSGGDMKVIAPLLEEANKSAASDPVKAYRAYTRASVMMTGAKWTPDAELATALDFAVNAKVIGAGEHLQTRAAFLFDAPAASNGPYRLDLEILKDDNTPEASVEPGIVLGDVRGRRGGETLGFIFDPSK